MSGGFAVKDESRGGVSPGLHKPVRLRTGAETWGYPGFRRLRLILDGEGARPPNALRNVVQPERSEVDSGRQPMTGAARSADGWGSSA